MSLYHKVICLSSRNVDTLEAKNFAFCGQKWKMDKWQNDLGGSGANKGVHFMDGHNTGAR